MKVRPTPRFTAIVPTHRRLDALGRALRSVARQQHQAHQVIVVNDGPAEDLEHIRRIVAASECVAQVQQNQRPAGPSGARNWGAQQAAGQWLAFLDDDDEWLPHYLAEAARHIEAAPLDVLCCAIAFEWVSGSGKPGRPVCPGLDPAQFLTQNPGVVGSNLIIRAELYRSLGGFDESLPFAEDQELGLRLGLRRDVRYQPIAEPLVRLYQHGGERLCTPRSEKVRIGVRRFFELHQHRMTLEQRQHYDRHMQALWGVDAAGQLI
ncbi:MAG TPA: glycosyltransferase family A protein [Terriglobales bacterium]|nr:glycosyltransferase family A protein [Terriglobales bacterium]